MHITHRRCNASDAAAIGQRNCAFELFAGLLHMPYAAKLMCCGCRQRWVLSGNPIPVPSPCAVAEQLGERPGAETRDKAGIDDSAAGVCCRSGPDP